MEILLKGYEVWSSYKLHTTTSTTNVLLRDFERRLYQPAFSFQNTEWHKKNGNFWKTQQKLKKSKKKHLLTEIEPLQLAF